jgi:alpha,alpha-trehalase
MEKNMQELSLNIDTTKKVLSYIKESWVKSIRPANETVPFPYTSPSVTGFFTGFFYWDNYFINKGLMLDGLDYQVENTLDNFKYYVEKIGYVPNGSTMLTRSQPPFFTKCVYEYYLHTNDKKVLEKYLPALLKEYEFWMTKRILSCGLNSYFCTATKEELKAVYIGLSKRVEEVRESEEEQISVAEDILAIAESGLDFNMRFITTQSKIDSKKFIHLDLNCILYDVEITLSKMLSILGDKEKSQEFLDYADKRKKLINEYLFDKEKGIYLDYNFVDNTFSSIISAVSLYPYTFGISCDKVGAKKVLDHLELPFGITPCASRGENALYFQWDYPCVWPYTTWFSYTALNNVGLKKDAERIAKKYMFNVNYNFEKTGAVWEKYDGRNGGIAVTNEYKTPEMLGWSAGVYRTFCEDFKL